MIYIGIDPGVTGAIAFIYNETQEVMDYTDPMCLNAMEEILNAREDVTAMIEKQWLKKGDYPTIGPLIQNYGEWVGRCAALCINYKVIAPRSWKAFMGITLTKEESRGLRDAQRLKLRKDKALDAARLFFPDMAGRLSRVKDHNRAEALLIAEYGRRAK